MTQIDMGADPRWAALRTSIEPGAVLVTDSGEAPWGQALMTPGHVVLADEPVEQGGRDSGPGPHDLVLMALGACTAITMRMYAVRKGWTIDRLAVRLSWGRTEASKPDHRRIERKIDLAGQLDDEQRARLFTIAEKCPVHQLLTTGVAIHSELVEPAERYPQ